MLPISMDSEHIELSTKQGKLKGLVKKTVVAKKTYYSFQGIPYAKPPVGKLRFKAPEPYGHWEGVRDATKEGNDCPQLHMLFNYPTGNEDCLYLNVYTTQCPGEGAAKMPVMVWIHGGGFTRGSGSSELYGPDFLVEEGVVLVTINYRCGALGFLSLENDKAPGNLGLKDQVLALRWVQEYIQGFCGDPNNVIIFGESAGSSGVHYHLLSPLSRGLFHKAILQSGFAVCQWAFQSKPKEKSLLLAKALGCNSENPDEILEFLLSVSATDIVNIQGTLLTDKERINKFGLVFLPCVEKSGNVPFLSECPHKIMEKGEFADVPVIIGVTNKEGMLALALKEIEIETVNADPSIMVPYDLAIPQSSDEPQKLGKEVLKFYTNNEYLSWDAMQGYIDFIGDVEFAFALENTRDSFLKHKTTPVYKYLFTYTSPRAFSNFLIPQSYPERAAEFVGSGASHGDELAFLFKTNMRQAPFIIPTGEDQTFINKFVKAWTTFAKTGNPNCDELGVSWIADSIQNPHFLELGKVLKDTNSTIFPNRIEFWKKLYGNYSYSY